MKVLVVGGSSSIGQDICRAFAGANHQIISTYASKPPVDDDGIEHLRLDLCQPSEISLFRDEIVRRWATLDHVTFLAGILPGNGLPDYAFEDMQRVMLINFISQAALLQCLLPLLSNGASVLFMGSIAGQQGSFDPIYAASKAAQTAFMKSLAKWHGNRVRFNCLAPGLIEDSTMFREMTAERRQFHIDDTPTGELLRKQDLASIVLELAGDQWRQLNGAVIPLSGGRFV